MSNSILNKRGSVVSLLDIRGLRSGTGQVHSIWAGNNAPPSITYLAVAAGGGGASAPSLVYYGSGGGGGGFSTGTLPTPLTGTVTVPAATNAGATGSSAVCFSVTSTGGSPGNTVSGPGGSQRFGGAGGTGTTTGATGGLGSSASSPTTNGGTGTSSSLSGSAVTYSDGGGGCANGVGGSGGGGTGSAVAGNNPTAGAANRGGGGGGADVYGGSGGAGGSGVVIISYSDAFDPITSIGAGLNYTLTVSGGNKIYRFTSGTGAVTI